MLDIYALDPYVVFPNSCWSPDCQEPTFGGGGDDEPITGSRELLDQVMEAEEEWNPSSSGGSVSDEIDQALLDREEQISNDEPPSTPVRARSSRR